MKNSTILLLILSFKTSGIFYKSDTILNKLLGTAKKASIYDEFFTKGTIYFESKSPLYIFNIRFLSSSAIFPEITKIQMIDTLPVSISLAAYNSSLLRFLRASD